MTSRRILAWILVTLLILFVAFNLSKVQVWLFGIEVAMPIGLVVIISAGMGAGATSLFLRLRRPRR